MATETVSVGIRLVYDTAKFMTWQLFHAGTELEIDNKRATAEVSPGVYRQLRWYAVSQEPEAEFTIRIVVPAGYRLRYPGVPVGKVDPDIAGKMPKTPEFKDFSGWRRIKLEKEST